MAGAPPNPPEVPAYQPVPANQAPTQQTLPGAATTMFGGAPGMEPSGLDIRRYVAILLAHWWLVLIFMILGAAGGAAYCLLATPLYRAGARLEIRLDQRLDFSEFGARSALQIVNQELVAMSMDMQGKKLRNEVARAMEGEWDDKLPEGAPSPEVSVSPVRRAEHIVDINVDAVNQNYALAYLRELIAVYKQLRSSTQRKRRADAQKDLSEEQESVSEKLQTTQDELANFQSEHSIRLSEAKAEWDERFLASLIQRQNALRMERTMLESQFAVLNKGASTGMIQDALNLTLETHNATLGRMLLSAGSGGESFREALAPVQGQRQDWQSQELLVARLKADYEDKLHIYKPDHPRMKDLQRQIDDVERDLTLTAEIALQRLQERQRAVEMQSEALENAVKTWRAELNLTVTERSRYQSLTARAAHLEKRHNQVYTRFLDAQVMDLDAIYINDRELPRNKGEIWPDRTKIMALSVVAGLGLAVGLAFLLDHLDTSVLDIRLIEQQLGLAYLSGVPHWGRVLKGFTTQDRVVVSRQKTNVATEVYRSLRSSVEHALGTTDTCFKLVITSSDSADGKSLTTLNLAIVFAWTGRRVLLVDGDLRRGTLHQPLECGESPGFTDLLCGRAADWRDVVQQTPYENMHFIPSGKFHQEAPELLNSARMRQLLTEWENDYDLIIFDSAPVGRVVDSAVISRNCDGVILVALFGKTRFADIRHTLHRLEGCQVIGFCLNAVDFQKATKSYAYKGYYGYGGYGYGYYGYGYGAYGYGAPYGERKSDKSEK